MGDHLSAVLVSLMALQLLLADRKPFRSCFIFLFLFCLLRDFHELWHSMMSACLIIEVKQQWVMSVLGMGDRLSYTQSMGCILTWNKFLSPDFHNFQCTICVCDGLAAHVYGSKDFSALFVNWF